MVRSAPQVVEYLHRQALRIGRGLQHDRRHGGDEDRFGDPLRPMAPDVAGDFAAAGGVADERGVLEIERLDDGCKIVGIAVHVVPRRGLAGPAMAATVVRDHAEAVLREEQHLAVPSVGAQRPAVRERDDRAFAPVLVVDFGAVLRGDRALTGSVNFSISFRLDLLIVNPFQIIVYKDRREISGMERTPMPKQEGSNT